MTARLLAAERSTRLRVPTSNSEMPRSTVLPDDPENRWSHRELIENRKLLRNAPQYNSLLRLTTRVMSPGGSGLWRPEEGPTAIKIEGEPYRFVCAGDYDSASLQYYLTGPTGGDQRAAAAAQVNDLGRSADGALMRYFGKRLQTTHHDIKHVMTKLAAAPERGDDAANTAELHFVFDHAGKAGTVKTFSALQPFTHSNVPTERMIVLRKKKGQYQKSAHLIRRSILRAVNAPNAIQGDVENDDDFRILGQWELNFGHFGGGQGRFHFACACKPS